MKKAIIVSFVICMLSYACNKPNKNIQDQYVVESLEFDITKPISLDSFGSIEVKEIIKLAVDSSMPLGRIDKVVLSKDRVFVLDRTFSKFIFVYNKQGKLLYKIGNKGSGPGEYVNGPKDFYVDESSRTITVFDSEVKRMYIYNGEGILINTRILEKTWPYSFTKSDSIFYFAYKTVDDDSYLLQMEDENENTLFKYKRLTEKRDFVADNCFYNTGKQVYFVEDFNNDIVVLNNKGIEKIVSINFGINSISKDFLTKHKGDDFINEALSNKKATKISNIVETNQLFAFQFVFEKMVYQLIYNKENGKYLTGISLNSGYFPSEILANDDNQLVSALSAEYIERLLEVKNEDLDGWNQLINSAHPVIKNILLDSKEGRADDYIFIYDLHL